MIGTVIAFFLGPIGRYIGGGLILMLVIGGIYGKGRYDGRAAYKATVAREIADAVQKGDSAREKAFKEFDANSELSDDGFMRK